MKYIQHKNNWKSCKLCKLYKQRMKVVLARGSIPCDVLFVGEAPGLSENVIGKPFVGPAGNLLTKLINLSGLNKYKLLFTNLVACIPKDNKDQGIHKPDEEDVLSCSPRLRELVDMADPTVIVCVGKLSQKLTQKSLQCSKDRYIWCNLIHPASLLRMDKMNQGTYVQETIESLSELVTHVKAV